MTGERQERMQWSHRQFWKELSLLLVVVVIVDDMTRKKKKGTGKPGRCKKRRLKKGWMAGRKAFRAP